MELIKFIAQHNSQSPTSTHADEIMLADSISAMIFIVLHIKNV